MESGQNFTLHSVMRLDKSTVSSACCNYDCMNLSLEKWLLAQSHRDDSVGELARKWVSNGKTQTNAREWLVDIGDYSNWRSTVERIVRKAHSLLSGVALFPIVRNRVAHAGEP